MPRLVAVSGRVGPAGLRVRAVFDGAPGAPGRWAEFTVDGSGARVLSSSSGAVDDQIAALLLMSFGRFPLTRRSS